MNLSENIKEALRSIASNRLRTVLTALIIAIGITALVGILTAIDGIESSINNNFANLGANSFDLNIPEQYGRRRRGKKNQNFKQFSYLEAISFKKAFDEKANTTISLMVSGAAEVKSATKKTNPNMTIMGSDENYLTIKSYKLEKGRNFTQNDNDATENVVILGYEAAKTLFENQNPINKSITVFGFKLNVIGTLGKKGSMTGGGEDRVLIVPLSLSRFLANNSEPRFSITSSVPNVSKMEGLIGEATGIMRQIRKDEVGGEDSFEIVRSDSMTKQFDDITGFLRVGGFVIGFITLLGAAIALMNIMMVSVTERTREIGIRKSLGATPSRIRQQFLIEAIVICIIGGIGGLILGIVVGNSISKLISQDADFIIPWVWMAAGIIICIIVGILSGIIPAIKASKLDPIESLRYE